MAKSRVALVTGGGGGIGRAICHRLSADGNSVLVADVDESRATAVAREISGRPLAFDVTDTGACRRALAEAADEAGAVEILVNCAGWDEFRAFRETDDSFVSKVIGLNLEAPIRLCRLVIPAMEEAGWGRVINIGSDAGRVGASLEAVYSGAKGGLIAFSKALAREEARFAITVNTICPGPTETPLLDAVRSTEAGEKVIEATRRSTPLRRLGLPEDIAPAVSFLASDDAAFITGQTLSVSGGLTMV